MTNPQRDKREVEVGAVEEEKNKEGKGRRESKLKEGRDR